MEDKNKIRKPWLPTKGDLMDEKDKTRYATQNLYEAAYCLAIGLKLSGRTLSGTKTVLIFEDEKGENAEEKAMSYYNGAKVEAKALMDNYRTLKDYVFTP